MSGLVIGVFTYFFLSFVLWMGDWEVNKVVVFLISFGVFILYTFGGKSKKRLTKWIEEIVNLLGF